LSKHRLASVRHLDRTTGCGRNPLNGTGKFQPTEQSAVKERRVGSPVEFFSVEKYERMAAWRRRGPAWSVPKFVNRNILQCSGLHVWCAVTPARQRPSIGVSRKRAPMTASADDEPVLNARSRGAIHAWLGLKCLGCERRFVCLQQWRLMT
jgi:hypothetical protein